jgi:hypothetical protein
LEHVFEFGGFPQDVTVTATGLARASDLRQLFGQLCADPRFEPGMRIMLDLSELDTSTVPLADAMRTGYTLGELECCYEGCAIAVVAKRPLTAVLTSAAKLGESTRRLVVRVVSSRSEAMTWLESQIVLQKLLRRSR